MKILFFIISLFIVSSSVAAAKTPEHYLLKQAESQNAERVKYALNNDASVELTEDGKSFYVLWFPENTSLGNPPAMIVTLHGHASWAFDEFYLWHQIAKERGYGILAIQWWLGKGEKYKDYLNTQEIYRVIDQVLSREHIQPRTALFHGFSRGSANSYAVAAMDNSIGKNYFALIVANAGKPGIDFPSNRDIEAGRFGPMPLQGTRWVTFAGGKDPHPDRDGIYGMREAAEWISKYGGKVELMIEDQNAGHGGFHRNPDNTRLAIDVFDKLLKESPYQ